MNDDHAHTETDANLRHQLEPIHTWLTDGGDAWAMDIAYWRRRDVDVLNRMRWEVQAILSRLDVTLHLFWPDDKPDRPAGPFSLTEAQMRSELLAHLRDLQRLGYLTDWSVSA
jgi:hypothetical protein